MTLRHEIDHAHRLVIVCGPGSSATAEAQDSARRLMADLTLSPDFGLLILVDRAAVPPSALEIEHMAQLFQQLHTRLRGPIAIVTTAVGHGTPAALLAVLSATNDAPVATFLSEHAARQWLNEQRARRTPT